MEQGYENVSFFAAFIAGLLSFLSPCILPLIPGYISFISGSTLTELTDAYELKKIKSKIIINSIFFIFGFSLVFIALGATATFLGKFLTENFKIFTFIAGIIIIIIGLHLTGILKINALLYEKKLNLNFKSIGILGSFITGFSFAFGWTPCVGPILAGILVIAGAQSTVFKGILLLATYSLGLAIPFFITSYSLTLFFKFFNSIRKYLNIIEIISGIFLIVIGLLILTDNLKIIAQWFSFLNIFAK
jgi:cytochrome c-type biogenesis protein